MSDSRRRAIRTYRSRSGERGLARFDVLGREADRALIRSLARRLADDTPEASELRTTIGRLCRGDSPATGGIRAALRRSPLVGAELDLSRTHEEGRSVDL